MAAHAALSAAPPHPAHLESPDGSALETQISLEILGDLSHQTLEGQLADEELGGLLVTTDLPQSHRSRPEQRLGLIRNLSVR